MAEQTGQQVITVTDPDGNEKRVLGVENYTEPTIPPEKLQVRESIPEACRELASAGEEPLYVVTCFSDRDKVLAHVEKEA